jgi:hypothetical protein
MTEENATSVRTQPDLATLSRFAMTTGTLLLVYVIGGGIVQKEWTSVLIPLKITRPEFLVVFFCGVSIYAAWRYWYYAIELPLTRRKIRNYLKSDKSILVLHGEDENELRATLTMSLGPQMKRVRIEHIRRIPPGFNPNEALLFTKVESSASSPELAKEIVAVAYAKYFPLLDSGQVEVLSAIDGFPQNAFWANISPRSTKTLLHCFAEDADLFAPVWLNGIGLALLVSSWFLCWPSSLCVFGGK